MVDTMNHDEILLIHLGGLGDMCLSESTFFSLSKHLGGDIVALGYMRFLRLFEHYFKRIERVESAKWLPLFSSNATDLKWKRIIFIGKDREGALREKWKKMSRETMIFIEMYPENGCSRIRGFEDSSEKAANRACMSGMRPERKCHAEDYQLLQLGGYGIEARKKEIAANLSKRIILYPEKGFKKEKWGYENFVGLYHALKDKGSDVHMLASMGLERDLNGALFFEEPADVRNYLVDGGGVFVSNDSGMAHLAGACGLYTVTVFTDFERDIWHPRGCGTWLQSGKDVIDIPSMESRIMDIVKRFC